MKKSTIAAFLLLLVFPGLGFSLSQDRGKIALIDLSGSITPSESTGLTATSGITPEEVRELNEQAREQGADAIIYEINSGGGAVVASKEVYREIEDVDVPTICRMRDVAASGGYLIALGCDRIVADSSTLTGSIGVKSSYIQYAGVLERLGGEYVNISTGRNKEIGNPFMNASEEDREILQEKVNIIQQEFLTQVEEERNLTDNQMENISTGEPFIGTEAERLGLVDELGGRETAIRVAENITGKDLRMFKVESSSDFNFLSLLTSRISFGNLFSKSSPLRASIF